MINNFKKIFLIGMLCIASGCSTVSEPFKVVLGSSIKALEDARIDGVSKIFKCDFDSCFDSILSLQRNISQDLSLNNSFDPAVVPPADQEEMNLNKKDEPSEGAFDVFMKDRIRSFIVIMGLKGSESATEVGIFLSRYDRHSFKIEISSLSYMAKQNAAEIIFNQLIQKFEEVKP